MFNQNNEAPKLDWMYKGPNSTVDREEYLLGRKIDKTLEQINEEDKQKQQGLTATVVSTKNRVEHECIPPSIRDFNKTAHAEQVDLSTKLQEDPLVAIKKREEETRREFLQNPIQLKKLQKALKAQQAKNEKKNKKKSKKKKKKKNKKQSSASLSNGDSSDVDDDLDTILMHKFNELKQHLTDDDLRDVLTGDISDSSDDDDDDVTKTKEKSKKTERYSNDEESEDDKHKNPHNTKPDHRRSPSNDSKYHRKYRDNSNNYKNDRRRRSRSPPPPQHSSRRRTPSRSNDDERKDRKHHYDSDDSNNKRNYGLVSSDGTKIPFKKPYHRDEKSKISRNVDKSSPPPPPPVEKSNERSRKRLTDDEKEKLRREMMENAVWRDKERESNVKKYRNEDEKDAKQVKDFDSNFIHKQMMKSTTSGSVESRIKSNLNNIQRSSRDMDRNFSKR